MQHCYQIALLLENRLCLVVGAGAVALRKIQGLLPTGACVRVVAPEAVPTVRQLAAEGALELHLRPYAAADLAGVFLAIVATADAGLNAAVSAECQQRGILVNVVDQPELCSFYVPAVVERGPLSLAISSSGASPALTKRLRLLLEQAVGEEYGLLSELMQQLRPEVKAGFATTEERAAAWERLLDSDVLDLLRAGQREAATQAARHALGLGPS